MESHRIISVKIVSGNQLQPPHPEWKSQMQVIETDKGEYIDNLPGEQHGYFATANKGYDWRAHIGETIHGIRIFYDSGHKWLNK